jgi:hypothetical protein
MSKLILIVFILILPIFANANKGITIPYIDFPMKKAEGVYSTRGKCNMCHSWGYTLNQGLQSKKFWHDKVMKMIIVYKAPIKTQKDIDTVVNYLFENYGNGELE